jgi:hypothetical protein
MAKVRTIVSLYKANCVKGVKDRDELVHKIMLYFKSNNFTHNSKGKKVTEENVARLVYNITRDIVKNREGWWNTFEVVETDTEFKLVGKQGA